MTDDNWNDGWDEDLDDIIPDEEEEQQEAEETDGWEDEDDLEDLVQSVAATPAPVPAPMPILRVPNAFENLPTPAPIPVPISDRIEDDAWDDGLDDLSGTAEEEDSVPTPAAGAPAPVPSPMPYATAAPTPSPATFTMDDGWEGGFPNDLHLAPTRAPVPLSEGTKNSGWADDGLDDLSESNGQAETGFPLTSAPRLTPMPHSPKPAPSPAPLTANDGWDDDLDDVSDNDQQPPALAPQNHLPKVSAPVPMPTPSPAAGWGDDLDDLDIENDEMGGVGSDYRPAPAVVPAPVRAPATTFQDAVEADGTGWDNDDDDDDLFADAVEGNNTPRTLEQAAHTHHHRVEKIHEELINYVEALMVQLPSVNAVLKAEYNNVEKAHELLRYYTERPQLRQYTIEKEVDRMDYQVILQHEHEDEPIVVENKQEITQMFRLQPELDLMVRCANQSLLADLLQVMTGPDRMIRPQYMATCLAQSCLFVLRPRQGTEGGLVECTSNLVLSLPEPSGDRYTVATLQVHIAFGIPTYPQESPMIHFELKKLNIVLPSMDILRPTAQFLLDSGLLDHPPISPFPGSSYGSAGNSGDFRDVFLQQSQNMIQNSTVGFKSAWKQIDSVAGFGTKMNMMKKIFPTGNSSMIEEAMKEQEVYQQQLQSQRQGHPSKMPSDSVPVSYPPSMHPISQQQYQQAAPQQQRPASILGSVWGRLAKTVTLPEEDPTIYEQYAHESQRNAPPVGGGRHPHHGMGGSGSDTQEAFAHLYRKDSSLDDAHQPGRAPAAPVPAPVSPPIKSSPWLSRLTQPSPLEPDPVAPSPVEPAGPPAKYNDEQEGDDDLELDDGWGDDDDLALDEIEEQTKVTSNVSSGAAPAANPTDVPIRSLAVSENSGVALVPPSEIASDTARLPESFGPEDDIIETRKRWVNPRPGYRHLGRLVS